MFDRPDSNAAFEENAEQESVVLVHLDFNDRGFDETQQEFLELVNSTGANISAVVHGKRQRPDSKYFAGTGKVEEIAELVAANDAAVVIFNHELSPSQERNLEQRLKCRVLGRTGLILDIFARRARSHEGKLQVELAQLQHLSTRLVRGWTHLERQKGGIGLRGPGETQLETDRRLLGQRIKSLKKRLEKVRSQRDQGRRSRQRAGVPVVSLVGYTNVGKSTLFNRMTASDVYADNRLFATLDPTLRRLRLADTEPLILADTVGFIRQLPHDLVESFSSTLEETRDASLLLHVVDAAAVDRDELMKHVDDVLQQIGADELPQLIIYNKIDRLENVQPKLERDQQGKICRIWLSAHTGEGLDLLRLALQEYFPEQLSAIESVN
ncbi:MULTISPECIES: ribosome rescue GTPase HflX [unclassified Methylophaga]|uniref:ribosome rescue GTPase HflX n=2 Tax=Methylophaga TaxID=40222 RepID=UPI000C99128A|nr:MULTISPECIES: ribosome rescue GTPase HflX [unclassified Methylophaga]MAK66609.1 GTPase HflX [Methylophaga sp.]MAY17513.1 GTPase HflX [Methylophaga sp.]MBN47455.1 GTPase HflX [Methylophaga sp.]